MQRWGGSPGQVPCHAAAGLPLQRAICYCFRMLQTSQTSIDAFIDTLWLEDGLSRNTLAAYRRDLQLCAQ